MVVELENIKKNQHLIQELYKFVKEKLGFKQDASISFIVNKKNAENPLGKTAYYDPQEQKVCIYIVGRHQKDVLRSLAHELCHHAQNERGEFNNVEATTEGYAQTDGHLREMEREAYEIGNMMFRDFEDLTKTQKGV